MRRREVLALLGGAASWPVVAGAQQSARKPQVARLSPLSRETDKPMIDSLLEGLRARGWSRPPHPNFQGG